MKFWKNKSLKQFAIYLLIGMSAIFLCEYLIIRSKIETLEEIEGKKDFARSTQLKGQQIAYIVQLHTSGQPGLAPEIYSRLNEQDHQLQTLGLGGRVDETEIFLKPLPRLPRISFDNLYNHWVTYRADVMSSIQNEPEIQQIIQESDSTSTITDSVSATVATSVAMVTEISKTSNKTVLAGQWLTMSNWYEKLMVDLQEEAENKKASVEGWFFFFIILDILIFSSLFYLFFKYVLKPLRKLTDNAANQHQDFSFPKNEVGALASEINVIIEQLKDATEFVAAIGEGKLDYDYTILDSEYKSGKNKLADSLVSMQLKLRQLNEAEQRRQWANEGLTKFVDILRSSNDNITTLGDKIISSLVKYTNSNQGSLYILNDEDESNKHLELVSLFAFDTKKYEAQKVKLGQGLLGQTFLERETTLLNDIPDEYIRITSGLGGANPKALLMVPLKVDTEVYGIVELASFKNYLPHEIAFVEKLAETIASTLASVRSAQKNRHLIEQFQQQTEVMRAQEEEMRQNMEELQATQEELARKEKDYINRINELEQQTKQIIPARDHERLKEELRLKELDYSATIKTLEQKLAEKPAKGDDWELATEVEKTLRIQLEALRLSEDNA
ncbi:GAF domain-containing protein [Chryseosolibacter indicus]|uniref:GAF domain-containing protein n=1 Tax=Chryseosolibacter indicus TaxID=2782351 RepID=A0ABS5VMY2_9BACT|nr:GAF domain-containing protein [Chryseosolibacter indicus]MBT1702804.1 GAF domain-containing protein [Chryseosolibacter indicus]